MANTPNSAADFWLGVDRTSGPDACWPWLRKLDAQGRARFHFEGRMRDVHQIAYFIEHGVWLRRYDLSACAQLRSCCNFRHIEKRRGIQHKALAHDFALIAKELDRQSAFSQYLSRQYPDLHWLIQLLGDHASQFLSEHEGQTLKLELTIPMRAQLIEEARAVDCYLTLEQAAPQDRQKALKRLGTQYQLDQAGVAACAKLGAALFKSAERA